MGWGNVFDSVVNVGLGLVGLNADRKANAKAHQQNQDIANANIEMQREFARNGIRWKVEDATNAGLHPLVGAGAGGAAFAPNAPFAVGDYGAGATFSNMGQNLSRAIHATRSNRERDEAMYRLQLQGMELENAIKSAELAKMKQVGPSFPSATNDPYLGGQVDFAKGLGNVIDKALERVTGHAKQPWQEPGAITDVGFARTHTGLAPVPSQDVKQRIEDQPIQELAWAARNQLLLENRNIPGPPKEALKLFPGAVGWKWYQPMMEWRPVYRSSGSVRSSESWLPAAGAAGLGILKSLRRATEDRIERSYRQRRGQ